MVCQPSIYSDVYCLSSIFLRRCLWSFSLLFCSDVYGRLTFCLVRCLWSVSIYLLRCLWSPQTKDIYDKDFDLNKERKIRFGDREISQISPSSVSLSLPNKKMPSHRDKIWTDSFKSPITVSNFIQRIFFLNHEFSYFGHRYLTT
jgi:hypothetical protein